MSDRKIRTKLLAVFLCVVMLITVLPISNKQVKAATNAEITQRLTELSASMNGKYWNAGIEVSNSNDFGLTNTRCGSTCHSNSYSGSWQCAGFARWLGKYIFGSDPYQSWRKYTSFSQAVLEPGDIIRTNEPHSGMVWKIEGDMVYVAECWGGSGCKLNWGCWNGNRSKASKSYISAHLVHWYKHPNGSMATPSNVNVPSNIYIGDAISYPTGNLGLGKPYPVRGTIYSSNLLTNVTGTIFNSANAAVQQKSVNPNSTSYSLSGPIDNAMIFNHLSAGSYRFVVSATDNKGYTKNVIDSGFTVGTIPSPSITASDVAGGVMIRMSAQEGTIHYTLDGSEPTSSSPTYVGEFHLGHSASIKAFAERNGSKSGVTVQSVTIKKLKTPEITMTMEEDSVAVSMESDAGAAIYYTLDGSAPNTSSERYLQSLHLKEAKKIRAIAVKNGAINSDIAEKDVKAEAPQTPSVSLSGANKIAVGDAAKVIWDKQEYAQSYVVKLYQNDEVVEEKTIQGCAYAFTLLSAGEYQITVSALNFMGSSIESYPPIKVTAIAPLTVTFADFDGKVISSQKVKYGYSAELPENPSRRGHDFKKWDNSSVYAAIKEDLLVKAEYTKKKYLVKFLDEEGNVYAPQQEVLFDESVNLPDEPVTDKIGYAFMGWRCMSNDEDSALDYEHIDANMTLQAVFDWGNKDMPVVSSITKALQTDSNSYQVSVSLTNWPESKTYCRLLVSLKTSNGKMVKTITRDVTLAAGATTAIENIELISDKVATVVEVNVVGMESQKTAGAYAKTVSAQTTSYANTVWSEWSAEIPPAGAIKESKAVYRYRDKIYTDSTSLGLSGWTQIGATGNISDWSGTCATTSYPGESDTLRIVGTKTDYNYYHYCCNYYSGGNNVDSIAYGTGRHYYHTLTTSSPLRTLAMADKGGKQAYGGKGTCSGCAANYYAWFLGGTTTTYYYQTRTISYVYHYSRWGDWSSYTDTPISSSGNREIEATQFYRYKIPMETPADKEDTTGNVYLEEGTLSGTELDLSGKCANILVYRSTNSDPTENQLEYVGQTVIGEQNAYSFSFIPKEEPEEAKSNYIVALAIEGQTSLYNIDVIYAEKVRYKVTFYDRSGEEISSCEVKSGESAEVPQAPEVPGYTFIGWDKDTTNVLSDRSVTAKYKENEYMVVYVDFENNTADMLPMTYGAVLPSPAVNETEGKTFLGWDKILDGTRTVDGNMILTARYEKKKYTVIFADEEDKIISKQEIDYGESAVLPDGISLDDGTFLGWSTDNSWWNVKNDMIVKPVLTNAKTADTPLYHIENVYRGGILTLSGTEGQDVYYAIEWEEDGLPEEMSETQEEDVEEEDAQWQLYEEEIFLDRNAEIHFYALGNKMNASNVVDIAYDCENHENPYMQTTKMSLADVQVQKGDMVEIPLVLQTNPRMSGMRFTVLYETSAFQNVNFQSDSSEPGKNLEYQIDEECGAIEFFWKNGEMQGATGKLGTLILQTKENVADGKYPLTFRYAQEDTYDDNWMDVKLEMSGGNIQIGNADDSGSSSFNEAEHKPSVSKVKSFKVKSGKKKLTLSWKKVSSAAGYQAQISTKKNFKGAKIIKISKEKKSYVKKSLKANKKYYIRIRAYKTYRDAYGKTMEAYGKWSKKMRKTR